MNVMLVNGSPHKNGCTHRALAEVATTLDAHGIESEMFWIGAKPAAGFSSARRAGTTAALDDMQMFLTISNMPIVSSR